MTNEEESIDMQFSFLHNNFNVTNLENSLAFYDQALGLKEVRPHGSGRRQLHHRLSRRRRK